MPRPRGPSNPEATKRRVLEAAEEAFSSKGFHESSLASIAGAAGITAPSLLHYFPDKESLFDAVLRRTWTRLGDEIRPVLDGGDATEIATHLFAALAAAEGREAQLFAGLNEAFLSGRELGSAAVNDTLLPLVSEVEEALRAAPPQAIPPEAPLFEALLYVVVSHAAVHRLTRVAPDAGQRVSDNEALMVNRLLAGVLGMG